MKDVICLTYYYSEFWGTDEFLKSCQEVGMPVYNAWPKGRDFKGHSKTIKYLYEGLKGIKKLGYEKVIYADAADSYFVRYFVPPDGKIVWSTEKAYYPEYSEGNFKDKYTDKKSQWCYLNGGGWCGPTDMLIDYFEKLGLLDYIGDINGQHEWHKALFEAKDLGIPIDLDQKCEYFQTTGFEHDGDFSIVVGAGDSKPVIHNNETDAFPCLFHGNGRTPMDWIYKLYK